MKWKTFRSLSLCLKDYETWSGIWGCSGELVVWGQRRDQGPSIKIYTVVYPGASFPLWLTVTEIEQCLLQWWELNTPNTPQGVGAICKAEKRTVRTARRRG